MKKTMLVMAMVIALAMSMMIPASADHVEPSGRFPALAQTDCLSYHGEWTRVNGVDIDGWVGPVRTCVVVTEKTEVETLQIGNSQREFDSTLTYQVTTTYVQYGNRNNNPEGIDGFQRTTTPVEVLLSCTNPGEGDGIWLPGENNCPTNMY